MTQHPFDREFSEQEAAKSNAEQQTDADDELSDEETEQVAGGSTFTTLAIGEEGGKPITRCGTPPRTGEEGGFGPK